MSKHDEQDLARRRFLQQTVFAAAASSATFLPAQSLGASSQAGVSNVCSGQQAPMADVRGKVAFVTGGTSGIGLAMAQAFVDAGMKVVVTGLSDGHLKEALAQFSNAGKSSEVHGIRVDVTDRAGMEAAAQETVQHFGKVHVLVNNAGIVDSATGSATDYRQWDNMIAVNVTGVFNGVHAFLPHIQAHGEGGQIVTTASIAGLFVVTGHYAAYGASKFAVLGFMEALRAEFLETPIGVSVVCPGLVRTNLEDALKTMAVASDPAQVGELTLRGIRRNDFYILTHPEFEPVMRARHEALMGAIPKGVRPGEERVAMGRGMAEKSIYVAERRRQRCL